MQEFNLYHLKFRELNRLERNIKQLEPKNAHEQTMLDNAKLCVQAYDTLLNVSSLRKKDADIDAIWLEKVKAAKFLLDSEWYPLVATVKAKNLPEVIKRTSNGTFPWFDMPHKSIEIKEEPWRETFSYDIAQFAGQTYMYLSSGWIDLNTAEFVGDKI